MHLNEGTERRVLEKIIPSILHMLFLMLFSATINIASLWGSLNDEHFQTMRPSRLVVIYGIFNVIELFLYKFIHSTCPLYRQHTETNIFVLASNTLLKSHNSTCLACSYQQTDPYFSKCYMSVSRLAQLHSTFKTQGLSYSNRSVRIWTCVRVPIV